MSRLRERLSKNLENYKKKRAIEKERDKKLQTKVDKAKRQQYEKGRIARAKDDGWREGIGVKPKTSSSMLGRAKSIGSTIARMSDSFQEDFLIDSGFKQKPKPHRKAKPKKNRNKNKKRTTKNKRNKKKKQKQPKQDYFLM